MNEKEWRDCMDPQKMLASLGKSKQASKRKLRLFAVACIRRIWRLIMHDTSSKRSVKFRRMSCVQPYDDSGPLNP